MSHIMKSIRIILCVALLATLAVPALAYAPSADGNSRHPCIFLDNTTMAKKTFWYSRGYTSTRYQITFMNVTMMRSHLDAARNLTNFLEERGYPVDDLKASLENATIAIGNNNVSAFHETACNFLQDLHTEIEKGVIDRGVVAEYFQAFHVATGTPAHIWAKNTSHVIQALTTIPRWIVHHVIAGH
jgi:hypothetical protein